MNSQLLSPAKTARLTSRERSLIPLLLAGRRNKEIAFQLGISKDSVKVYFSRLYRKLGVSNGRLELAMRMRELESFAGAPEGTLPFGPRFADFLCLAQTIRLTGDEMHQILVVLLRKASA